MVNQTSRYGLSRWLSGKEPACQFKRHRFNPWSGKIPWRRKWQPTPVLLPKKSHGERSLVGYGPQCHKRFRHILATAAAAKSLQSHLNFCDPMGCSPLGSSLHGDSPGKMTRVGCHALLQGIFLTQGLNSGFFTTEPPGEPWHSNSTTITTNRSKYPTKCRNEWTM